MKRILILFIVIQSVSSHLYAQSDLPISKQKLIGLWQINSPRVGNGYAECFSFFGDGTFIYQYDPSDDTRGIIKLKGKYRLDKGGLYLTILSRVERVGGKILTGAGGTDEYLFVFDNDKMKQVTELAPKELDPLIISKVNTVNNKIDFYINNRHYYKVATDPNKVKDQ
jgi:hypothetical protein